MKHQNHPVILVKSARPSMVVVTMVGHGKSLMLTL